MDITAPVTDYVPDSLLTTKGDWIRHDGISMARYPSILPLQPDVAGFNTGIKTVEQVYIEVAELNLGTVALLDYHTIQATFEGQKLIADGDLTCQFGLKSGTAWISFDGGQLVFEKVFTYTQPGIYFNSFSSRSDITQIGTLIIKLEMLCSAGSFVIQDGMASLSSIRLGRP